jgi:hypothetical protein
MSSIPYNFLVPTGDSSPYFGTYEGQRYGFWDTNSCWDFAACEVAETHLEMLLDLGKIPQIHTNWLKENRYIDEEGDFYLSRRWVAILSGARDQGNLEINFWNIASDKGLIPNSLLPYSVIDASKWISRGQFNNDYFNTNVITQAMKDMGQEFLKRFQILAEPIPVKGNTIDPIELESYLKEGSIQIAVIAAQDGSWNVQKVDNPVGKKVGAHSVELYKYDPIADPAYPYFIYDSYENHLKQLAKDYPITVATRVSILPIPVSVPVEAQKGVWAKVWEAVNKYFNS